MLKIDRSFVTGIGLDREDRAIVKAIISLAKSLNLAITAEGIETEDQSALLRDWACEHGRGTISPGRSTQPTSSGFCKPLEGYPWSNPGRPKRAQLTPMSGTSHGSQRRRRRAPGSGSQMTACGTAQSGRCR